jgi:hypothetical protein
MALLLPGNTERARMMHPMTTMAPGEGAAVRLGKPPPNKWKALAVGVWLSRN